MFTDLLYNTKLNAIITNITSEIPDDFHCEKVVLWNGYGISPYFANYLGASVYAMLEKVDHHLSAELLETSITTGNSGSSNGNGNTNNNDGEYNVCEKVKKWELILGVECESMLCDYKEHVDYLPQYVKQVTNGECSIFDWMNYCKYCKKGNSTSYACDPKDDYTRMMISSFPTSALYCGTLGFGIPIIVNTSSVNSILLQKSTHFNIGTDYNFICYCVDGYDGYFAFKCSDTRHNFMVQSFLKYSVIILHAIAIVSLIIFLVIPKMVIGKSKNRFNYILPSIACLFGELLTLVALILAECTISELAILAIDYFSLSFSGIALYSWLFNWLRLVLLLKNGGEEPTRFLQYLHFSIIFICLALAIGAILAHTLTSFDHIYLIIYSIISTITLISLISLTIFVFRTMKKFSDVNFLRTSLVHFLVFISVFIVIAPITKVLEIAFIFTMLTEALRYLFLLVLFVSVAYMDSSREEFLDAYKKVWKILNQYCYSREKSSLTNMKKKKNIGGIGGELIDSSGGAIACTNSSSGNHGLNEPFLVNTSSDISDNM